MSIERKLIGTTDAAAAASVYVEDVFQSFLYTGTGASQTINNGIDLATKGGLVWIKSRVDAYSNEIYDTVRGAGSVIFTNGTNAAISRPTGVSSFSNSGFGIGDVATINNSGSNIVSWTFAKQPKFFDVVTYTGDGTTSKSVSHSLGVNPGMIIVKRTDAAQDWFVWHRSLSTNQYAWLNSTNAANTYANIFGTINTSTFTVGDPGGGPNVTNGQYVAYLFADSNSGGFGPAGTDSVVACGSYAGTGSDQTISLGWEPQFVLLKIYNEAGWDWYIHDNMRGSLNQTTTAYLSPNTSAAETTGSTAQVRATATGFSVNGATLFGASGKSWIYLAIRRGPMKTPTDATKVFSPNAYTWAANSVLTTGFPADLSISNLRNYSGTNRTFSDRLRGSTAATGTVIFSNSTAAEQSTGGGVGFQSNTSVIENYWGVSGYTAINWNFRRAPGFFDVVCYTGTGGFSQTVKHNLTVEPELILVKMRNDVTNWRGYAKTVGNNYTLMLNRDFSVTAVGVVDDWNYQTPSATNFYVAGNTNDFGKTYVAYLFATCPGVSKVGSYTGSGTTKQIDCGFAAGARFVIIKRTDSTGNWYVWDTARGLVSGNDPYLLLNSTAAEVTNTDYIDPYSAGFEISSTAPAEINASGGTYIYLAIA